MKKNVLVKKLSSLTMALFLLTAAGVKANGNEGGPCDEKIVIECGIEYTANLIPNSGSWVNYTNFPYNYTGSEQVFEFVAPANGLYTFDVNQGSNDADFMIMSSCSNTGGNVSGFYWTGEHEEYITLEEGVTYFIIADLYEGSQATTVSIKINCPEGVVISEPDFDCFQGDGITATYDDGFNLDPINTQTKIADDFTVDAGTTFTIRQITIDTNQIQSPDFAVINIREDVNGFPGDVLETVEMAPTSSVAYAAAYNEPIYHLTFDLAEPLTFNEGTYWLEPKMTTPQPSTVWWLATSSGSHGSLALVSEDNGATWFTVEDYQAVFFVAGDCEQLGVEDLSSFDFSYFPNPVNDVLTINSQKAVKSVEVFNLTGQKVMNTSKLTRGEVNVSALSAGVYVFKATLENGQIETFKVVKK